MKIDAYLEEGSKRTFAVAVDWPGWCRRGRNAEEAIEVLLEAGPRYKRSVGGAARGLGVPRSAADLEVVERVEGDATTDFGAPSKTIARDDDPLDEKEARRHERLLVACWKAFDVASEAAIGVELRKGPRGGGRDLDKIVEHLYEADAAYFRSFGGRPPKDGDPGMADLRAAITRELRSRAEGEPPERMPRSGKVWALRYFIRRSAWHAIDHAWEIEDRAT